MTGECGDRLKVILTTTDLAEEKKASFPGLGWGYAWVDKGILTLSLKD